MNSKFKGIISDDGNIRKNKREYKKQTGTSISQFEENIRERKNNFIKTKFFTYILVKKSKENFFSFNFL